MIRSWFQTGRKSRACNTGAQVGSWPERLETAWSLFREVVPSDQPSWQVADYGCGRQELRRLLPSGWSYAPYDWMSRSQDTVVCDFRHELPQSSHDVIFILGVLEHLPKPARLLRHALLQSRWVVFSCFHGWNPMRAWREGWKGRLTRSQVESLLSENRIEIRNYRPWRQDGSLWVCENPSFKGGAKA